MSIRVIDMVSIVISSSFHWYFKHGSRWYITHIKRYSRTPYVVWKKNMSDGGCNFKVVFFSK